MYLGLHKPLGKRGEQVSLFFKGRGDSNLRNIKGSKKVLWECYILEVEIRRKTLI